MSPEFDISVVIVSYNTASMITKAIDSVLKQKNVRFELIVIDNWSPDNSVAVLRSYQDKINLIVNSSNLGSGQAANQGFRRARGKLLYLLNPDAELQSELALSAICRFMRNHSRCGLAGTRVLEQQDTVDVLPRLSYPFQQYTKANFDHLPGKIAWVLGASIALRQDVFELTGGFSKDYFLYGDEVDLCLRIRKHGYEIDYIQDVVVSHLGRGSEKNTRAYDYWIKKQKGLYTFIKAHYSMEDSVRILRIEKNRAFWRSLFLQISKRFFGLNSQQLEKLERYRAIYDSSKWSLEKK